MTDAAPVAAGLPAVAEVARTRYFQPIGGTTNVDVSARPSGKPDAAWPTPIPAERRSPQTLTGASDELLERLVPLMRAGAAENADA